MKHNPKLNEKRKGGKRKKETPFLPISCNQPACFSLHLIVGSSRQFLALRKSHDHCNIMYEFRIRLFQDSQGHSKVSIYHTSAQHSTQASNSSQTTNLRALLPQK